MRFNLALRNTFRNSRRTALSVCMIAGGVASILIFEGFARNLVIGLRETTIQTQTGHLQIASRKYWEKTASEPQQALLPNSETIAKKIRAVPEVAYVAGRLSFYGLLSKGDESQSARGVTLDPVHERARLASFRFLRGNAFGPEAKFHTIVGAGLAKKMRVAVGDQVTVLGYTFDGSVNALDLEVSGIFSTAIAEFDDATFIVPLTTAQLLLDTRNVEQIIVGLKNTDSTSAMESRIQAALGNEILVRPWTKVAKLYSQVSAFNKIQNRIVEFILVTLMILGIMNTVGMSIFERMGEIGTLRAMGESAWSLVYQFTLEGIVLGALGAFTGATLGTLAAKTINALKIPLVMPGANTYLQIQIDLFPEAFLAAITLAMGAALVAAFIPAVRATRLNIVEALKRNV